MDRVEPPGAGLPAIRRIGPTGGSVLEVIYATADSAGPDFAARIGVVGQGESVVLSGRVHATGPGQQWFELSSGGWISGRNLAISSESILTDYAARISPWTRLAAYLLDLTAILALVILTTWAVSSVTPSNGARLTAVADLTRRESWSAVAVVWALAAAGLYKPVFEVLGSATIGKRVLGLRVALDPSHKTTASPGIRRLGRFVMYVVFAAIPIVNLAWAIDIASSDGRRGWHDRIAGTMVAKRRR